MGTAKGKQNMVQANQNCKMARKTRTQKSPFQGQQSEKCGSVRVYTNAAPSLGCYWMTTLLAFQAVCHFWTWETNSQLLATVFDSLTLIMRAVTTSTTTTKVEEYLPNELFNICTPHRLWCSFITDRNILSQRCHSPEVTLRGNKNYFSFYLLYIYTHTHTYIHAYIHRHIHTIICIYYICYICIYVYIYYICNYFPDVY
jgi:hypothetical protein